MILGLKIFILVFLSFLLNTEAFSQVKEECFSNFPVDTLLVKKKPPLQFLDGTYSYRTNIRETYEKQKVDFAGYYSVVKWGCGSGCQAQAFVNLKTGTAKFLLPTYGTATGIEVRSHSRLLLENPDVPHDFIVSTKYYVLESDSLKHILKGDLPTNCFD